MQFSSKKIGVSFKALASNSTELLLSHEPLDCVLVS